MINPNIYYTVQGWMISELGLKGNALAAYAIIYGFSQDGASEYSGSARYLCEWLGCSRSTVMEVLKKLTESGLLIKRDIYKNGVMFCTYTTAPRGCPNPGQGVQNSDRGCPIPGQGGDQFPDRGCPIPGHNNTRDNSINNSSNINNAQKEEDTPPTPPQPPKITTAEINKFFELIWTLYPEKKGKGKVSESKRRELHKIGLEEMSRAIERYLKDLEKDAEWRHPQHGSTFFNSGYVDYLDKNYKPYTPAPQPARPAGRGYGAPPPNVGPNGIAIDPSMNDLDGQF